MISNLHQATIHRLSLINQKAISLLRNSQYLLLSQRLRIRYRVNVRVATTNSTNIRTTTLDYENIRISTLYYICDSYRPRRSCTLTMGFTTIEQLISSV